jgi:hypothetical protein
LRSGEVSKHIQCLHTRCKRELQLFQETCFFQWETSAIHVNLK